MNILRKREAQRVSRKERIKELSEAISLFKKYRDDGDKSIDPNVFLPTLENFKSDSQLADIIDPIELIDLDKAETKLEQLESEDFRITPEDIEKLKQLITKIGAKYIQAEGESDPVCYALTNSRQVDAIISDDSDLLVYGVKNIITNYDIITGSCDLISLDKVLEDLEFTQSQFVDFCIMCGSDYNDNIKGIGPVKSYDLISRLKSIENIRSSIGKFPEGFLKSRELFSTVPEIQKVGYWDICCDKSLAAFAFENNIKEDPTEIFCPVKVIFE